MQCILFNKKKTYRKTLLRYAIFNIKVEISLYFAYTTLLPLAWKLQNKPRLTCEMNVN